MVLGAESPGTLEAPSTCLVCPYNRQLASVSLPSIQDSMGVRDLSRKLVCGVPARGLHPLPSRTSQLPPPDPALNIHVLALNLFPLSIPLPSPPLPSADPWRPAQRGWLYPQHPQRGCGDGGQAGLQAAASSWSRVIVGEHLPLSSVFSSVKRGSQRHRSVPHQEECGPGVGDKHMTDLSL